MLDHAEQSVLEHDYASALKAYVDLIEESRPDVWIRMKDEPRWLGLRPYCWGQIRALPPEVLAPMQNRFWPPFARAVQHAKEQEDVRGMRVALRDAPFPAFEATGRILLAGVELDEGLVVRARGYLAQASLPQNLMEGLKEVRGIFARWRELAHSIEPVGDEASRTPGDHLRRLWSLPVEKSRRKGGILPKVYGTADRAIILHLSGAVEVVTAWGEALFHRKPRRRVALYSGGRTITLPAPMLAVDHEGQRAWVAEVSSIRSAGRVRQVSVRMHTIDLSAGRSLGSLRVKLRFLPAVIAYHDGYLFFSGMEPGLGELVMAASYDLGGGGLRWQTTLGHAVEESGRAGKLPKWGKGTSTPVPAPAGMECAISDEGFAVLVNHRHLMLVDRDTGEGQWAAEVGRRPRRGGRPRRPSLKLARRELLMDRGMVYCLPRRSSVVVAFDARTGAPRWRREVPDSVSLLGAEADVVVVAQEYGASGLEQVGDGAIRWTWTSDQRVEGVGTTTRGRAMIPAGGQIVQVECQQGTVVGTLNRANDDFCVLGTMGDLISELTMSQWAGYARVPSAGVAALIERWERKRDLPALRLAASLQWMHGMGEAAIQTLQTYAQHEVGDARGRAVRQVVRWSRQRARQLAEDRAWEAAVTQLESTAGMRPAPGPSLRAIIFWDLANLAEHKIQDAQRAKKWYGAILGVAPDEQMVEASTGHQRNLREVAQERLARLEGYP